jgi:hypothetical protein
MLQELLDLDSGLTDWELDFLDGPRGLTKWQGDFTPKQFNCLEKIWNRLLGDEVTHG